MTLLTPCRTFERIAAALPDADADRRAESGHLLMLEHPELVDRPLLAAGRSAQADVRPGDRAGAAATAADTQAFGAPAGRAAAGRRPDGAGSGRSAPARPRSPRASAPASASAARVVSPTFVIARGAQGGRLPLVHVDAYRLGSLDEVDDLDLDVSIADSVTVVEWGGGLVEQLTEPVEISCRGKPTEVRAARADAGRRRLGRPANGGDWAATDLPSDRLASRLGWPACSSWSSTPPRPRSPPALVELAAGGAPALLAERVTSTPGPTASVLAPVVAGLPGRGRRRPRRPGGDRGRPRARPVHRAAGRPGDRGRARRRGRPAQLRGLLAGRHRGRRTPSVASLLVAGDARRREVYWAGYADGQRIGEPRVGRPAELALTAGCTAMAGAGAALYADVLGLPLLDGRFPTAVGLARWPPSGCWPARPAEPLTPLYLRRPDAVAPAARKPVRLRVTEPGRADRCGRCARPTWTCCCRTSRRCSAPSPGRGPATWTSWPTPRPRYYLVAEADGADGPARCWAAAA